MGDNVRFSTGLARVSGTVKAQNVPILVRSGCGMGHDTTDRKEKKPNKKK